MPRPGPRPAASRGLTCFLPRRRLRQTPAFCTSEARPPLQRHFQRGSVGAPASAAPLTVLAPALHAHPPPRPPPLPPGRGLQAGRAGRDGVHSSCTLLWSAADAAKNAVIKVGAGCCCFKPGWPMPLEDARAGDAACSAAASCCVCDGLPPPCPCALPRSRASMPVLRRRRSATPAATPSRPTSTRPAAGGWAMPGILLQAGAGVGQRQRRARTPLLAKRATPLHSLYPLTVGH